MIDTPNILDASVQHTATIHLTVPRTKMQSVMGPAIQEVMAAVAAQGAVPIGPVFSYHLKLPTDVFDFEVGVPVANVVLASGRVKPSVLPKARVARTIYRGPYEGLGVAWGEFNEWIAGQSLHAAPSLWECYAVGPQAASDPSAWQTELNRPLVD
jgi:effector-binding domain-containing protein